MRSFTAITILLFCSHGWISVSGCESQSVEVLHGENVTLRCRNISTSPSLTEWFRIVNRTKGSCISSMYGYQHTASFCDGIHHGKFEMSSNVSTVFLNINRVDLSDSGLYFCGFYMKAHTVIAKVIELNIQGTSGSNCATNINTQEQAEGITTPTLISMILGGLSVLLTTTVIALAAKLQKLKKAINEQQPEQSKNLRSDDLNYAALSFQAKAKRSHRPKRELQPNVVYAATR
ncbi:T-cell surface glycoprotein CD8 beta chain-like [Parambassis ranga]|uniref:T-cell surface glycoprotein CD8 beta chain-like n=1 Tax=Parambassis ranga TaxID=210632 RepID=A0A6P7KAS1_9TELE|nr:T-cell surface glycoprotein CD8 beta chain-like [Parambassis ranga]